MLYRYPDGWRGLDWVSSFQAFKACWNIILQDQKKGTRTCRVPMHDGLQQQVVTLESRAGDSKRRISVDVDVAATSSVTVLLEGLVVLRV